MNITKFVRTAFFLKHLQIALVLYLVPKFNYKKSIPKVFVRKVTLAYFSTRSEVAPSRSY